MTTYKQSGVDIEAGNAFVKRLKNLCPEIGGFGGLFPLGEDYLVASTDGVGTKLKLAFMTNCHNSIGIDLVAMNVNDVLTAGAKPLFFLDYLSTSKLDIDKSEQVVKGIVAGCQEAGCVLLGGETAEMPDFYREGEYDLAGFAVGLVKKSQLINGDDIKCGDILVGISSSGLHSNGYSLVRKILKDSNISLDDQFEDTATTIGEVLLTPTRIYVRKILKLLENFKIKGMAHITGGGFIDNIPRMLPFGTAALINKSAWKIPLIFQWLQKMGSVDEIEMFRTFNMGIGMVMALSPQEAQALCRSDKECIAIGKVVAGEGVLWE